MQKKKCEVSSHAKWHVHVTSVPPNRERRDFADLTLKEKIMELLAKEVLKTTIVWGILGVHLMT